MIPFSRVVSFLTQYNTVICEVLFPRISATCLCVSDLMLPARLFDTVYKIVGESVPQGCVSLSAQFLPHWVYGNSGFYEVYRLSIVAALSFGDAQSTTVGLSSPRQLYCSLPCSFFPSAWASPEFFTSSKLETQNDDYEKEDNFYLANSARSFYN